MRITIVGCGSIGLRHARNLLALGKRNLIVVELRRERREFVRKELGVPVVASTQEAFRGKVDVAFVTSPTHLHLRHAEEALRAGAHLFIEKPLAHVLDARVRKLLEHAKRKRRKIFVAVNMRFHPGIRKIKVLLDRRAIGNVLAARVEAGFWLPDWHPGKDYRKWYMAHRRLGGGVLLDGIHEIDYLCWLLGDPVDVVARALRVSSLKIDTEDVAEITLRFANGALGNIHVDYLQQAYQRTCRIIGSEGTIEWDFHKRAVRLFSAKTKTWRTFPYTFRNTNQMYVDELKFFFAALAGRIKDPMDGREGLRSLAIAEAARRSERTGRRVLVQF